QAEDGIRDFHVTGVQTCALPIFLAAPQLGQPSLYDTTPALDTLRRLVDFTRIDGGEPRITINLTDLISGDSVLIDSASARLRPRSEERRVGKEQSSRWAVGYWPI